MKLEVSRYRGGRFSVALAILLAMTTWGCASFGVRPVSPEDIPGLQAQTEREPGNGTAHLRLAAALAAADRCDEAVAAAERGRALRPQDPVGPLVIGGCLEAAGQHDEALALYAGFIELYEDAPGAAAVEGRRALALRDRAREEAQAAIQGEETLQPADPETVGVLPFLIDGDTTYHPLSAGLAHMLTTDLALLQRFRLVERVRLGALLQELEIPSEMIDPNTAARTGRLLRASRMVLGTASIPSERQARLGGNIVLETGELVEPLMSEGDLRDLFDLEKELAIQTAEGLGYQLTQADLQRIRDNRPASLIAFLAFSRGLMAEDLGDFGAAAAHYAEALRADPGFGEAQQRLRESVGADAITESTPEEVTTVVVTADRNLGGYTDPDPTTGGLSGANVISNTLDGSIIDVASHQSERATIDAGNSNPNVDVLPEDPVVPPIVAMILITIRIPR